MLPGITLQPKDTKACTGGAVNFTAAANGAGELSVQWQVSVDGGVSWVDMAGETKLTLTFIASTSEDGNQYRAVFSSKGCLPVNTNAAILTITILAAPNLIITDPVMVCATAVDITLPGITNGSEANLSFTYWRDAAATDPLSNPSGITQSGTYFIKATNAGNCFVIRPVNVSINAAYPRMVITDTLFACSPSTVDLTAPAVTAGSDPAVNFTYWKDAATTLALTNASAVSVSNTYYIKGTINGACSLVVPVVILINPIPAATISGVESICAGAVTTLDISLTGTSPWSIVYTDGFSKFTIRGITTTVYKLPVSPQVTATYTILSVSDNACSNTAVNAALTIKVIPVLPPVRYPTVFAIANTPKQLAARTIGADYSYQWNPAKGLDFTNSINPVFKNDVSMQYTIVIRSPAGCTVTDTLLVSIQQSSGSKSDLFVPKAWSPNGDGYNDKLFPLMVNIRELKFFRVFNRWGQIMFETNEPGKGWDGTFNGKPQASNVYTWTTEAIGLDNRYYKRTGSSILLR